MPPALIVYSTAAVFGLILGSFLNVCIARLPRNQSIVSPRSHCPRCKKPIRWYDNVPVLSYVFLAGRCRDCRERISPVYPLVEILTAAILVVTLARWGLTPSFVKFGAFNLLLIILIFTDLRERRIPHALTLLGTSAGLLLSLLVPVDNRPLEWALRHAGIFLEGPASSLVGAISGAFLGGGFFYAVGEIFFKLRKKEGLGFGDVMLMLMVGSFLGIPLTLMTIFLGSLAGTLVGGTLHLVSKRYREYEWPYGSFLGAAAIYTGLGGNALFDAYLRWAGLA